MSRVNAELWPKRNSRCSAHRGRWAGICRWAALAARPNRPQWLSSSLALSRDTLSEHLAPKQLIEDEETGAKSYRYVRTGTNHYSLAFTYDWLASEQERKSCGDSFMHVLDDDDDDSIPSMGRLLRHMRNEGLEWPPRWNKLY